MSLLAWVWGLVPSVSLDFPQSTGGSKAKRQMEFVLAVAVYVSLGVALVTAAIWYATAVWQRFLAVDPTPAIAPIEIVGADEAVAKSYRTGLPAMIVAATNELKSRTNLAIQALADARSALAQEPSLPEHAELPVPVEFREPLAINVKIAAVEVGPLLASFLDRTRDPNLVRLTVALGSDGKTSRVYGFLPGSAGYAFTARAEGDLPSIAEAVAAQFLHRAAQRGEAAFAALDPTAFLKTVSGLETYARLTVSRRWIMTGAGSPSAAEVRLREEYARVLAEAKELAQRYTAWEGLQWLAAQSAREARDWASAREFNANLKRLADRAGNTSLGARLALFGQEAERELAAAEREQARLAARDSGQPSPPAQATAPTDAMVARVLAAMGLSQPGDGSGVTVGVVGPAPPQSLSGNAKIEVIGAAAAAGPADPLPILHVQAIVAQIIAAVAPNVTLVYAPFPTNRYALSDAVESVNLLVERNPHMILMNFSSAEPSRVVNDLIKRSAERVLFVAAAGNTSGSSVYGDIADVALVAAAVTQDGVPAAFTSTAPGVVWALGAGIPMIPPGATTVQEVAGTTYAAASVTAAAVLLKHDFPRASPAQVRQALFETAKPAQGRTPPPIINVPLAAEWLRSRVGRGG